jgi:uncharacterized protein YbjT (DUF2867 family)
VLLTGPEALSYADVANLIGEARGSPVVHHNLDVAGLAARFEADGLPPAYAQGMAAMDGELAIGSEDRVTAEVLTATGRSPRSFSEFARTFAALWRARP